jgi:hypothetical protein
MKLPEYEAHLRLQPCVACGCKPTNPHHCGSHGTAKRNHDEDACSMCFECHRYFHDHLTISSREGLLRKAKEQFNAWLATLPEKKRNKIESKLKEEKK